MSTKIRLIFIILLLMPCAVWNTRVQASNNLPDATTVGYGAYLDLYGKNLSQAVNLAHELGLSWISLNFDWSRLWPDPKASPDINAITQVMQMAQQKNLRVMISITNVPAWANTPTGPDANITKNVVISLAKIYPETLSAVELFPGANSAQGWGAKPDPQAYLNLFQVITLALQENKLNLLLVASLTPQSPDSSANDQDDLAFLQNLYQLGASPVMPVIGVQMSNISGDPMTTPSTSEHRVLRHYEEIRKVMLANNHRKGIIWITSINWPRNDSDTSKPSTLDKQANWLTQALNLVTAQLYIGAVFVRQLNPIDADPVQQAAVPSLIQPDSSLHPACDRITELTHNNQPIPTTNEKTIQTATPEKGNAASEVKNVLTKKISSKPDFKHGNP